MEKQRVEIDVVLFAVSAGVTFGIGSVCSTITNFYTRAAVSALAHGVFQGGLSAAQGGKFWAGFAAGTLSSIAASVWKGGNSFRHFDSVDVNVVTAVHAGIGAGTGAIGTLAFSAIVGGAGSALAGGNFWQGATTGLIVSGFNHLMHQGDSYDGDGEGDPPVKMKPASAYDYSQEVIDGKFTDDWNYILNGDGGNPFSRAGEIFSRDWNMASTGDKVGLALSATPFRLIRIGKFGVEANTLHRVIKPAILKATPKAFVKVVGKNPDIIVKGENIFLTGAKSSPFYGKSYNTGLKAIDYFK